MTTFDTLMGHCLIELPGAPSLIVSSALGSAARALCLEASCWEETQNISLSANQPDYALDVPVGGTVRLIKSLVLNGVPLTPTSRQAIADLSPGLLTQVGQPTHYYFSSDFEIHLLPTPGEAQDDQLIAVEVAYVPTFGAVTLPSNLIERFAETLIYGAKARVMAMPGREWANPQMAAYYQTEFTNGVNKARVEKLTDYGRADLTVKPRRF